MPGPGKIENASILGSRKTSEGVTAKDIISPSSEKIGIGGGTGHVADMAAGHP